MCSWQIFAFVLMKSTGLEGLDPREGPPDSALSTVTLLALSLPPLCSRHVYIIHPTASYHAGQKSRGFQSSNPGLPSPMCPGHKMLQTCTGVVGHVHIKALLVLWIILTAQKQYSSSTEIRRVPGHRLSNLENHTAKLSAHPTCQFDLGQLLLFQTLLGKRLWGCTSHLLFSVGNMDKVMLLWERTKFTFTDAK